MLLNSAGSSIFIINFSGFTRLLLITFLALLTSSSLHLAAKESDASTNSSSSLFKRHQRPSFERFLLYATISNPMTTEEDARMMPKRHLEQLEPSGTSKKTNDSKNSSPAAEEEYNRTSNGKSKNRMRQLRRYYRKRLQQDATNEKEGKGGKWDPSLATAATSESPTKKKQPAEELKTVWQMYNRCTEGFLQVASSSDGGGGETTAVSARGRLPGYECRTHFIPMFPVDDFTANILQRTKPSFLLQHAQTKQFLCLNNRSFRVVVKKTASDPRCRFREHMTNGGYTKLESAWAPGLFIGASNRQGQKSSLKAGRPGTAANSASAKCFHFSKLAKSLTQREIDRVSCLATASAGEGGAERGRRSFAAGTRKRAAAAGNRGRIHQHHDRPAEGMLRDIAKKTLLQQIEIF